MIEFGVKPPKFSWKEIPKFKDKLYPYSSIQIVEIGQDMYIRYSGSGVKYAVVKNWRSFPLTSIIVNIIERFGDINRHLEEALHWFYKSNNMCFGYVKPILKQQCYL